MNWKKKTNKKKRSQNCCWFLCAIDWVNARLSHAHIIARGISKYKTTNQEINGNIIYESLELISIYWIKQESMNQAYTILGYEFARNAMKMEIKKKHTKEMRDLKSIKQEPSVNVCMF